jgi:hypothetical protein
MYLGKFANLDTSAGVPGAYNCDGLKGGEKLEFCEIVSRTSPGT